MNKENQETIADIVSEMRIGDLCASDTAARSMYINDFLTSYADRIEAAHKREREAGAEAVQICGEIGEMVGREEAKNHSVTDCNRLGNAAKMREALENIAEYAKTAECHTEDAHLLSYLNQIESWTEAALSEPPRNCDRLSADKCKQVLKMEMEVYLPQEVTDNDREIAQRTAYGVIDALFAPYTEQKGESNGSK